MLHTNGLTMNKLCGYATLIIRNLKIQKRRSRLEHICPPVHPSDQLSNHPSNKHKNVLDWEYQRGLFLKRQPKFLHVNYITLFSRHLKIHRKY